MSRAANLQGRLVSLNTTVFGYADVQDGPSRYPVEDGFLGRGGDLVTNHPCVAVYCVVVHAASCMDAHAVFTLYLDPQPYIWVDDSGGWVAWC